MQFNLLSSSFTRSDWGVMWVFPGSSTTHDSKNFEEQQMVEWHMADQHIDEQYIAKQHIAKNRNEQHVA